jgi:arylsulfatase A-like enzyme
VRRRGAAGRTTAAVAAAALLAACGCGGGTDETPAVGARHAVLVTIDTWRADCFGAGGHPAARTPNLDRFFRGGLQFAEAYSPAPTTLASHTSILSGQWPTRHGVPRNLFHVPGDVVTLPQILQDAGFRTAAYVSTAALDDRFGLDRGFDVYNAHSTRTVAGDYAWRPAAETLAAARRWWSVHPERKFLWVHFFEPHFPYEPAAVDAALHDTGYRGPVDGSMESLHRIWAEPPDEAVRAHVASLYLAEITGLDRTIGAFLREIVADGETITVLTADHGESLGERGAGSYFVHGPTVYPQDVRVPLVVRGAPPFTPGVSAAMVRTIDVPATFLRALGVSAPLPAEGRDLADAPRDGAGGVPADESGYDARVLAVASMPWRVETDGEYRNLRKQRCARTPERAVVVTPWESRSEWFDRRSDPGELHARPDPPDAEAAALEPELEEWIEGARVVADSAAFPPELRERLRSLGYAD